MDDFKAKPKKNRARKTVDEYQNRAQKAQLIKDDDFFTTYEHVKIVFEYYLKDVDFSEKSIYCFCDGEESSFVKYLKDHKDDIGYSELIYTDDDYNNHVDLFEKADYIITNPPFSKITKDIKKYIIGKKFFLFGSFMNIESYYRHFIDIPGFKYIINGDYCSKIENTYINKGKTKLVRTVYITNIEEVNIDMGRYDKYVLSGKKLNEIDNIFVKVNKNHYYKSYQDIYDKYGLHVGMEVLCVDKMKDIPVDYDGWMCVPCSVFLNYWSRYFIIPKILHLDYDWKPKYREKYYRVLCKLKPEYVEK